jgi:outer membrane murein-binding lipoprotein Lpp
MGRAILGTVVGLALALAGCGGDDEADAPPRPKLPAELAAALAYESDQIAATLAEGRECAAHRQAQALRAHVGDAVGSGQVPPALGREMSAAASSLDDGIVCEPPPPPAPEPEPKEKPAATPCEQLSAQLAQLEAQVEQAKEQEKAAHGPDKQAAKDAREQLEDQAKQLEDQIRFQCEELEGGGSEENVVPPGQQTGHPGNGNSGQD